MGAVCFTAGAGRDEKARTKRAVTSSTWKGEGKEEEGRGEKVEGRGCLREDVGSWKGEVWLRKAGDREWKLL